MGVSVEISREGRLAICGNVDSRYFPCLANRRTASNALTFPSPIHSLPLTLK
jgi:hypothetical protein